jgi:hypothetical protein
MSVWSFEAAYITDTKDLESCPIYLTPEISAFLRSPDERSQLRVIGGLKGTGKTLFLKLISHHYRQLGGVTLIPKEPLTERLYSIEYDFSKDRAQTWASPERWDHIWRTVLSTVILKAVKHSLPSEVLEIFPSDKCGLSIGGHLSEAIRSRAANAIASQSLFSDYLDDPIQNISGPVALFLDNIDEALGKHVGIELLRSSTRGQSQSGTHSYELWVAAQIGFIIAVHELTSRNAHLKIYGTVRAEALRDNRSPTAFNEQATVLDLHYTPEELRGIFAKKLEQLRKLSPESFRATPDAEADPVKAFLPAGKIKHPEVTTADGVPYEEDAFCYLRRHTRGRPRELDYLGQEIQMIPPEQRTHDAVRKVVEHLSRKFFEFARNEAVPFWNPRLDELLAKLPSNFITRTRALNIARRIFGKDSAIEPWNALAANGLCGAAVVGQSKGQVQHFANHDRVTDLSSSDFDSARTWVIHPCATIAKRAEQVGCHANSRNVAGHGYPFVPENKNHIHVLVGAGKLGLGLVVPKLLENPRTRMLVAARASDQWAPLLAHAAAGGGTSVEIQYFGKPEEPTRCKRIAVRLVADTQRGWQETVAEAVRKQPCTMLVYSNLSSLEWALRLGNSVGVSVGPKELQGLAKQIANAAIYPKLVLAYENDAEQMRIAHDELGQKNVTLVPTVVDRICAEREICADRVIVKVESHGSITALVDRSKFRSLPPAFGAREDASVRAVFTESDFAFVRERKTRLVNSLHAAAAALVETTLMNAGATKADDYRLLGVIISGMENWGQLVLLKDVMILSVLGMLPPERLEGSSLAKLVSELNAFGELALERIRQAPDSPSRVLPSNIESLLKRYARLIEDVEANALEALKHRPVRALFTLTKDDVHARLYTLNAAFLRLIERANKEGVRT